MQRKIFGVIFRRFLIVALLLLVNLEACSEVYLIKPGYEQFRVSQSVNILKRRNVRVLQGILCQKVILQITVGQALVSLIGCGIHFSKRVAVSLLYHFDKLSQILVIELCHRCNLYCLLLYILVLTFIVWIVNALVRKCNEFCDALAVFLCLECNTI